MFSSRSILAAVVLLEGLIAPLAGRASGAGEMEAAVSSNGPQPSLSVVSEDPYTTPGTYHRTQVEPDTAAFGSTIVSTFQTGRSLEWGASNLGWSVSTDAGATWTSGFLSGTTIHTDSPGPWKRVVDPSVAYDAKHDTWLVEGLGTRSLDGLKDRVFVSLSTDGAQTFGEPVIVARANRSQYFDKNWITCDNTTTSPFYGNCYSAWHDDGHDLRLHAYTTADGGLTWIKAGTPSDPCVLGVQPVVQPNGTVVMPYSVGCDYRFESFVSADGGDTYVGPFDMPAINGRRVHGGLRMPQWPSADVDATGTVYVVWQDCQFRDFGARQHCTHNDIVMSTSTDGRHWADVVRIPIDPRASSVDHFLPAIAVDPATSGSLAHLAIVYYFYPDADCNRSTCELSVGFVSSADGGSKWTSQQLAGPFKTTWFPLTYSGYMVGDYISVSFVDGNAIPVFTVATEGTCELGDNTSCNVWTASATIPLVSGS